MVSAYVRDAAQLAHPKIEQAKSRLFPRSHTVYGKMTFLQSTILVKMTKIR